MGYDPGKEGVMMANEVKITLNGIDQNLKKLALANEKVRFTAEKAAAFFVAEALQHNTPYEGKNSTRSWHAQRQMDKKYGKKTTFKHLRDDVTIGKDQDGTYLVGFGHDTYWRAHFVELGTANQPTNPFIEKTMNETAEGTRLIMEAVIRKGLGL
jgi:HK97 gp10 family phage protein